VDDLRQQLNRLASGWRTGALSNWARVTSGWWPPMAELPAATHCCR